MARHIVARTTEIAPGGNKVVEVEGRGIVVFHPTGKEFNFGRRLALQLADQLAVGIILAIVLAQSVTRSYAGRLVLVTLIGLIPFLMVSFPYWNWYAFPRNFTVVAFIDGLLTIFCGGLVLAAMVKPVAISAGTGASSPTPTPTTGVMAA